MHRPLDATGRWLPQPSFRLLGNELDVYERWVRECLTLPVGFVEMDFWRTGGRSFLAPQDLSSDYYIFVTDPLRETSIHRWSVRDCVPSLTIPLFEDEEVWVDLGVLYAKTYDRARYAQSIDYTLIPTAVAEEDQEWAVQVATTPCNGA